MGRIGSDLCLTGTGLACQPQVNPTAITDGAIWHAKAVNSAMNFLIASSGFREGANYYENVLAVWLVGQGHQVSVVRGASPEWPGLEAGEARPLGYTVYSIQRHWRIKDTYITATNFAKLLDATRPEVAFLTAPGSGMPYFLMKRLPPACKVVAMMPDFDANATPTRPWVKWLLKDRWYANIFARANVITASSPDGKGLVRRIANGRYMDKYWFGGLVYDPLDFYPGPTLPPCPIRFSTITRVVPSKPFERWLPPVFEFLEKHPDAHYTLAGFDGGAYSQKIRSLVNNSKVARQIECRDAVSAVGMREIFQASHFALWFTAAISVQQSMGCGLPVLLPNQSSLSHLVEVGRNGLIWRELGELAFLLDRMTKINWDSSEVLRLNRRSCADVVFPELLAQIC